MLLVRLIVFVLLLCSYGTGYAFDPILSLSNNGDIIQDSNPEGNHKKEDYLVSQHANADFGITSSSDQKLKGVFGFSNLQKHFSVAYKNATCLLYFDSCKSIDLRLGRSAIAYIFHSFP